MHRRHTDRQNTSGTSSLAAASKHIQVLEQAVVRLHRTIPAPPERVYPAWLEPELLRRWLAPGSLEVTRVEVDERVGRHYRIWQGDADGEVGGSNAS